MCPAGLSTIMILVYTTPMPKKTKKQKQHAVQHRSAPHAVTHHETSQPQAAAAAEKSSGHHYTFTKTVSSSSPKTQISAFDNTLDAIHRDLTKTLILAGLACATIIVLSFVLH